MFSENNYIGQHIDNYRIIANMSSSHTSSVYHAEQSHPGHPTVAIKILHSAQISEPRRNSFLKEVQLLKKLRHPHILSLQEAGIFEGMPYLVTEYAPGGSLRDRITLQSTSILPMQETLAILAQVGQALQYAHQFNFTHGNLKPENILFVEENSALLADFTIVTSMDAFSAYHQVNTLPYMAPERFQGWMIKESDQYALGCIAYELLTGQLPFFASEFSEFKRKHATEKPIAPTQLNLLLPISLEETILRAMEKKSEDRYPSIKDFVASLTLSASTSSHVSVHTIEHSPAHTYVPGKYPLNASAPSFSNSSVYPVVNSSLTKNDRSEAERMHSIHRGAAPSSSLPIPVPAKRHEPSKKSALPGLSMSQKEEVTAAPSTSMTRRVPLPLGSQMSAFAHRGGKSVSRQMWLILPSLLVVIIVIIFSALHFALTTSSSLPSRPTVVSQNPLLTPTHSLTPAQRPMPTPTSAPASKLASMPTSTPFPMPTPTSKPSPTLTVTPSSLRGETDCHKSGISYICTVTLLLPQNAPGNVKWFATASNISVVFNPSKGKLSPGKQQSVNAEVTTTCPQTGSLNFFSQDGEVSVQWTC